MFKNIKSLWERIVDSTETAQRNALKNIIRFFVIILAITMISRGTSGVTLARVEVKSPSRAEITESIKGTAEVVAKDSLEITIPGGLIIGEMLVSVGSIVSSGDSIAVFDVERVNELLKRETAKLDQLLFDLEKLNRALSADDFSLLSAQRNVSRAQEDLDRIRKQGEAEVAAALHDFNVASSRLADSPDYSAVENASRAVARAQQDFTAIKAQGDIDVSAARQTVIDRQADYDNIDGSADPTGKAQALADLQAAIAAFDAVAQTAAANELDATRKLEDARDALRRAEADYIRNTNQANQSLLTEIDRARATYEQTRDRVIDAVLNAERRLEDALSSLTAAQDGYSQSEQQVSDNEILNEINAVPLQFDIESAYVTVDKLQKLLDNNGILYSDIAGAVSTVKMAGTLTDSSPIVTFIDSGKGFEAVLLLKASEVDNLKIGDECIVQLEGGSMYYTPTTTCIITSISPPNEDDYVKITMELPDGNWKQGQRIDIKITTHRQTYQICVPISAIRSDNSGYFVLVIEQTVSVLGIVNMVMRVPVLVDASDSEMAAVSGPLDFGSAVITGSNKAIQSGDRVRIVNS